MSAPVPGPRPARAEIRRDLKPWPNSPRHNAAAAALQFFGGVDPDSSRFLAERVVRAIDRAERRPTDGLPTEHEIQRLQTVMRRRGRELSHDEAYGILLGLFVEEIA